LQNRYDVNHLKSPLSCFGRQAVDTIWLAAETPADNNGDSKVI